LSCLVVLYFLSTYKIFEVIIRRITEEKEKGKRAFRARVTSHESKELTGEDNRHNIEVL